VAETELAERMQILRSLFLAYRLDLVYPLDRPPFLALSLFRRLLPSLWQRKEFREAMSRKRVPARSEEERKRRGDKKTSTETREIVPLLR